MLATETLFTNNNLILVKPTPISPSLISSRNLNHVRWQESGTSSCICRWLCYRHCSLQPGRACCSLACGFSITFKCDIFEPYKGNGGDEVTLVDTLRIDDMLKISATVSSTIILCRWSSIRADNFRVVKALSILRFGKP
jgi:hypothetical protein